MLPISTNHCCWVTTDWSRPTPEARGGVHLIQTLGPAAMEVWFSQRKIGMRILEEGRADARRQKQHHMSLQTLAMWLYCKYRQGGYDGEKEHPSPQGTDIVGETKEQANKRF